MTTKREAEELALAAATTLDVTVVNPSAIFGPVHREANFLTFLRRVADGRVGPLAPPGGLSVVGVQDTARGVALALERGVAGRRYILTESNHSLRDLLSMVAVRLGRRPVRGSVPRPLWPLVGLGARAVDSVRPLEVATPQALRMLGVNFFFDSSRARRELGWEPEPFPSVLDRTLSALRASGLLTVRD